jgi:lysozyme
VGDTVSRGSAESLLYQDVKAVARELDDKLGWWRKMEEPRQGVLLNMAFNMGVPALMGFKRALAAAKENDWNKAAFEMADSRWAEQVKHRSRELITQFALGAWQEA